MGACDTEWVHVTVHPFQSHLAAVIPGIDNEWVGACDNEWVHVTVHPFQSHLAAVIPGFDNEAPQCPTLLLAMRGLSLYALHLCV